LFFELLFSFDCFSGLVTEATFFCRNDKRFLRAVDKARLVVVIIRSLGVEAAASRAVNEIPTPNGVA
jgi:hypothetical protein